MSELPSPLPPEFGLGRVIEEDPRDSEYPFSLVLPGSLPKITRRKWTLGPVLDQGRTGSCVGHGCRNLLAATPVPVKATSPSAIDIYFSATRLDDNPYNDGDPQSGTSVRAGMQALRQLGMIGSYVWEYSSEGIANWVLRKGPVVIGVAWYQGMKATDADGYIHATGRELGGHCVCLYGTDVETRTHWIVNSWSSAWGLGGSAKITWDELDNLLANSGEAVAATEMRLR